MPKPQSSVDFTYKKDKKGTMIMFIIKDKYDNREKSQIWFW